MNRTRFALHLLALVALLLRCSPASSDDGTPRRLGVSIEHFSYRDTSGEPVDQAAVHDRRLRAFMAALRGDVEADRRLRLAPAAQADARFRVVGGIQKTSTLVQWAKVAVIDAGTGKVVFDKLYTFRGDNDAAWQHAEAFVSRDVIAALAEPAPIALAVFDFELDDMTAAASAAGLAEADVTRLTEVSDAVREALRQSGHYRMIDVSRASADAVKSRSLRDCGGCDAAIAASLGAERFD